MMLITGASGRVARRTAELLAGEGRPLRLMTRTPQRVPDLMGTEVVYGDFADPASLDHAFAGVTTALVVSGSAEPGKRALLHRNAFDAAVRAHVQHVVYLSLQGAGPDSKYPFSRDHALSEQFLAATGLAFTVLRNAFYMDMFLDMFDAAGVIRGPAKQGRGAFVSREDCARVAAAALNAPPEGTYDITGREALSLTDVARRLSDIVGRELRYEDESVEAGREWRSKSGEPAWRVELSLGWVRGDCRGRIGADQRHRPTFYRTEPSGHRELFCCVSWSAVWLATGGQCIMKTRAPGSGSTCVVQSQQPLLFVLLAGLKELDLFGVKLASPRPSV